MIENNICPIWRTIAKFEPNYGCDYKIVDSPRAGGRYLISGTAIAIVENLSDNEKILLTSWIIEQHRLGIAVPKLTSDTLKEIKNSRPLSVHERADNLLRYLDNKSEHLGNTVTFDAYAKVANNLELLAWTSSTKISEVITLAEYCDKKEWIELQKHKPTNMRIPYEIMLLPDGYARLAEIDGTSKDSAQCFVAMWFDDSMNDIYKNAVKPAVEICGYEPVRVDEVQHNGKIDDRIIAEIKRSRFIIADFTCEEDKPRGGVYYEAGFAHGLNIPVIFTCHKDLIDHVHFDTRQFNHIVWKDPQDLKEQLINRISAVIGDGPNKK